ncbi:hypothetical protein [Streptomyces sp. NPDC101115]|uniref:hypothetical protein n=1 Tax=Streptomyces sp. NPDC101115 TaxID=3366106 RepID=UPI0037FFD7BC
MKTRQDIAALLNAGLSISEIVRTHRINAKRVRAVRDALGIPPHPPGAKRASIDQTFQRRTIPTDDGHLLWPSSDCRIRAVESASISAARYAFQQKYGRPPVGNVLPGCGTPRCVHPDHVEDQPMRRALESQLATIFGSTR